MGMCMNHYHLARRKYIIRIYISGVGGEEKTERRGKIVEGEKFMSVWSFSVKQRRRI